MLNDFRYAFRQLLKNPGFTAAAVVTLALGIGVNSAIFGCVNAMLLHPFPFPDLERIVTVWETAPKQNLYHASVAPTNFQDWRQQAEGFEFLAALRGWAVNFTGEGAVERIEGYRVTDAFFSLLGIPARVGRAISAQDLGPDRAPVVVLSHGFWQRQFASDPEIVGKLVLLNGQKHTVIGVMPDDFDFPVGAEAWVPLDLSIAEWNDRQNHYLKVFGRLKAGVSLAAAESGLTRLAVHLSEQFPQTNADHSVRLVTLVDDLTSGSRPFVLLQVGAAGFVLLLASANVANLQLARRMSRAREVAVRMALGAGTWRLARLVLFESLLLAALGSAVGLVLASWGLALARQAIPPFVLQHISGLKQLQVDGRVAAFTVLIGLTAACLTVTVQWVRTHRASLSEMLKQAGTSGATFQRDRLRGGLVIGEVALAMILLVGAGLMVHGFRTLLNGDTGFSRSHLLTFSLGLTETKYPDRVQIAAFYNDLVLRLKSLPGVEAATTVSSLPSGWSWTSVPYTAEGQLPLAPGEMRIAVSQSVMPDFFRTFRVPLLAGRPFSRFDGPDSERVVVISQSFARRVWPDTDPLGRTIHFGSGEKSATGCKVVGVAGDVKQSLFDSEVHPTAYFPFPQTTRAEATMVLRTSGEPLTAVAAVRAVVQRLDPDLPIQHVRTLEQVMSEEVSGVDFTARMMFAFGVIAVLLAASGIFALMSCSVMRRTHEIGVRMALGARRRDVLRLIVTDSLRLTIPGLAIGIVCAWGLTHAVSSLLFGILRPEVWLFALMTVVLALVAMLAAYLPALRAARVDPVEALRCE